ncbi:unnamed protein product [Durusdinium trenchii]|uniref:Uncharacterized protein n=1 Tax=Durusdinium trenchii TaxID=1381693 RepID=A0ABP0QRH5_9DINO
MEARFPLRSHLPGSKPREEQMAPLDPLLHDQLSSMGQEISHMLLRAGPPLDFEAPFRLTEEKECKRRIIPDFEKPKASTPRDFKMEKAHLAMPMAEAVPPSPGVAPTMCSRCHVLNMQVRALAQSLAGLGAKAFNWSMGLSKLQRRDLAEAVLEYCRPCAHLDTTLEGLCIDLENIHWGKVASVGNLNQQAPPADWISQAKQAQTSELPAHSRPSGPEAGGTPGSATGAVSALKDQDHDLSLICDPGSTPSVRPSVASAAGSLSLPLSKSEVPEATVQQRLQEILEQGQQQRLDVASLQELQRLLTTVASGLSPKATEALSPSPLSPRSEASLKERSLFCPQQSTSPSPGTRQKLPEHHGPPLLVPRQQDLPPRHPPALQGPLSAHPATGPQSRSPRSATPPERPSTPVVPHRALGREAKLCSDVLGGPRGETTSLGGPVDERLSSSGLQPPDVERQRLSGVPSEMTSQTSSGLQPALLEQQRLSGVQQDLPSQRLSGAPALDVERQRLSGVPPAEVSQQRVSGLQPPDVERQRLSGVPAEMASQRLSGAQLTEVEQRLSGTKLDVQMASVAAVGGSFEISPGAASTQHAETTPGGGSGDDGWEDDDQWQKKNTGGEVTLAAPQIQVKAPPASGSEGTSPAKVEDTTRVVRGSDPAPQVQRETSGLSGDKPKAAAAAATKKASRFTFMGMSRKK